jgi:hypothetical protein
VGLTGELDLTMPEGWFALDADPTTRRAAMTAEVDAWAAGQRERMAHRGDLVEILLGFGKEADDKGALFAAVYWEPGDYGPTAANLMVLHGARQHPHSAQAEVTALVESLARPGPADYGRRHVTEVKLPLGSAVRLRLLATADADVDQGEPALILDATQVWIPLPDEPATVVVTASTPCLDAGDAVAGVVDAVAATLRAAAGKGRP